MSLKACIFDLDGVIVDTAKYHYYAWKRLAETLGFYFSEEENEKLKGVSRMESLKILLSVGKISKTQKEMEELAELKNKWYVEYISTITPKDILPGSLEVLDFLKNRNIKLAIGSASKNARTILKGLEIENIFNTIIDGNRVTKAKPDPEIFMTAAEDLKVNYNECIVFEDAFSGIEAAKNAGMKAVGIGEKTILIKADIVIKSLEDLNCNILFELV
jgi:beta-phosphoglucomutase